ncbi:MAG: hypothetical protein ABSH34_17680 [Verrucomicrobiota bacterium]|jgi:hypothetical protein
MSVEQLQEQIQKLPREELAQLVGWLDLFLGRASVSDYRPEAELDEDEVAELLRRRDAVLADSSLARPVDDEYFANLKQDVADARSRKASGS